MRYVLIVLLPSLAMAAEAPAIASGRALLALPLSQFQAYVSGIYEGQGLLAAALKAPQIICVDPMMNRRELARLVREGIAGLPDRELRRPARILVFRALLAKAPCPGVRKKNGGL